MRAIGSVIRDARLVDKSRPIPPDVFAIAVEHIAWCISQGMTLREVFDCLADPVYRGRPPPPPPGATWQDAIYAVACAYDLGAEIRARTARWSDTGKKRQAA